MIKSYWFTHKGKTAALGEGTRKGHERDGVRDAAEGEGGGTFQNLGGAGRQLPSAAGQTQVSLDQQLLHVASVFLLPYFSPHRGFFCCVVMATLCVIPDKLSGSFSFSLTSICCASWTDLRSESAMAVPNPSTCWRSTSAQKMTILLWKCTSHTPF